jgi:hypothetical protein
MLDSMNNIGVERTVSITSAIAVRNNIVVILHNMAQIPLICISKNGTVNAGVVAPTMQTHGSLFSQEPS